MFFLIAPLLFIGLMSPAYSVNENKQSNEHLISLRDYDFVGEDQRLSALLAERMAVLQAPLNLSEPKGGGPAPEPAVPWVNVSAAFAELINASMLTLAPGPGGAPAPRPGRAPAPGYGRAPAPGIRRASAASSDTRLDRVDRRRRLEEEKPDYLTDEMLRLMQAAIDGIKGMFWVPYKDPSFLQYNLKILDMMKQSIYSTQRRMVELDPLIHKYERDPRFRMAFIYKRLHEWLHDMRTLLYYLLNWRMWRTRVKRVIWYYEHLLRLNINITYSIEHLLYLHAEYTRNLDLIVPPDQRETLQQMQKQQRQFKKMQALGLGLPNG